MSMPVERLEAELLELPTRERARLAHRLIESLGSEEESSSADADTVLAREIERRAERAVLLEEIAAAEEQVARGAVMDHATAKATLLHRIRR